MPKSRDKAFEKWEVVVIDEDDEVEINAASVGNKKQNAGFV